MLYQKNIGYLSQRFRWPTWVRYDYSFRQEAADLGKLDWSQLDYGLHAKYFHHVTPHWTHGAPRATRWTTARGTAPSQSKESHRPGNPPRKDRALLSPQLSNAPCPKEPYRTGPRYATILIMGTGCADLAPSAPMGMPAGAARVRTPCPSADDRAQAETTTNWTSNWTSKD